MSLIAAMSAGRNALNASSVGIQVASNNMANASTPGYTRQVARLAPLRSGGGGLQVSIGSGVTMLGVQRQLDAGLEARLRQGASDDAAASTLSQLYGQVETTLGELGDNDLSSELSSFFTSWSERANQTRSSAAVIQQGDKLAQFIRGLRSDLSSQRRQIDDQLGSTVVRANDLITSIAALNQAISDTETGDAPANTLRDQRDNAITELASLMDVSVVDRGRDGTDVLVGSIPVVLGSSARGLELRRETSDTGTTLSVATKVGGSQLTVSSGRIGALLASRTDAVDTTINRLDGLASAVIFEVNKLHSTGTNVSGLTRTTGTLAFPTADRTLALNDPTNQTAAGLPHNATNGGFLVNVRQQSTGAIETVRIPIDLDGVNATGVPGTGDDTSAEDIRAAIGAIPGLTASFTADGRLDVTASPGFDFSFSDDSSNAVAVLGLNSYFTGSDASDIAVRSDLASDSSKLTAGRLVNGQIVENGTAMAIAGLQNKGLESLAGQSITDHWRDTFQAVGGAASTARSQAESASVVRDSLEAQRASVSGVSIDEESISLLDFQRQYQAAARVISTADELTQVLLTLL